MMLMVVACGGDRRVCVRRDGRTEDPHDQGCPRQAAGAREQRALGGGLGEEV